MSDDGRSTADFAVVARTSVSILEQAISLQERWRCYTPPLVISGLLPR